MLPKVLLIEAEIPSIELATLVLNGITEVIAARNMRHAAELLKEPNWNLIIADHEVLDGVTSPFLRELREQGLQIEILAVSSATHPSVSVEMIEAGCAAFLPKPYSTDEFRELVCKLLARSV